MLVTFLNNRSFWHGFICLCAQSRIKGQGGPGQFSLEGPCDVLYDAIVCKIHVFADSQRSRLHFQVVDYVPAVLTRLLVAFDCKPHEMASKINVSCP